jgi:hypothetical protein
LGVRPSGASPEPRVGPLGRGVNLGPWGGIAVSGLSSSGLF